MARDAVEEVGEKMVTWQKRLSAHLRRRCLARAGKTGFHGWRELAVGSRRQRRMLVRGAATWVKSRLRRCLLTWQGALSTRVPFILSAFKKTKKNK